MSPNDRQTLKPYLCLLVLAPFIAEVVLGNTLVIQWLNPLAFLGQVAVYGSSAIFAREIWKTFKGGYLSLFAICGMTGALVEGLTVGSWFNPNWKDLGWMKFYGQVHGVEWTWLFHLQNYHAIQSTLLPIILTEMFFPIEAELSWLTKKRALVLSIVLLFFVVLFRLFLHFAVTFEQIGLVLVVCGCAVTLGYLLRNVKLPRPKVRSVKFAFWWIFGSWLIYFLLEFGFIKNIPVSLFIALTFVVGIGFVALPFLEALEWKEGTNIRGWVLGSVTFYLFLNIVSIALKGWFEVLNIAGTLVFLTFLLRKLPNDGSNKGGSKDKVQVPSDGSVAPC